jgi:PAT family acetyl-CoA transporter-like MFS transporter 1
MSKTKRQKEEYDVVAETKSDEPEKSNLDGDYHNVALLLLLYLLQGIPQGISLAIPILLQNRGVSYTDQAGFSIAFFPFSSE